MNFRDGRRGFRGPAHERRGQEALRFERGEVSTEKWQHAGRDLIDEAAREGHQQLKLQGVAVRRGVRRGGRAGAAARADVDGDREGGAGVTRGVTVRSRRAERGELPDVVVCWW